MAAGLAGAAPSSSSSPTTTTVGPGVGSPVPTTAPLASSSAPDYLPRFKARIEERQRKMQQRKPVLVAPRLSETSTIDSNSKLSAFADSNSHGNENSQPSDDGVLLPGSPSSTSSESQPSLPVTAPMPMPEATTPPQIVKADSDGNPNGKTDENGEVGDFIGSIWDKMKIKLGFTPDCLNGGTKRSSGICVCRTHFSGDQCQKRECINNGTLTQTRNKNPPEEVCRCPHPQYITGNHCEIVHCMNGGRFVNGSCLCVDNWYTGQFCEHYAASWFAVLGIPLVCIAVIAFCCVICRLDFCPKRNLATGASSRSGSRHHRNRAHAEHRSASNHNLRRPPNPDRPRYHPVFYDIDERPPMIRENPLHSSQHICGLASYPEYNPALPPPSSDDFKPIEPPPSYEQAVATCSTLIPATPVHQRAPPTPNSVPPPPTYSPPRPTLAHQSSLSSTSDSSRTRGR
uniref:EGF-like domain-containing protein n=1 Tax=Panagrellus redivivus TaxID=6233 RepID=A0A7E4ZUS4_PANRE